jgi:hypothetical protein
VVSGSVVGVEVRGLVPPRSGVLGRLRYG